MQVVPVVGKKCRRIGSPKEASVSGAQWSDEIEREGRKLEIEIEIEIEREREEG